MHVSIDNTTGTGLEGALFQTRGLEFTYVAEAGESLDMAQRLALAVVAQTANVREGFAPLGGERRLMRWRQSTKKLPQCSSDLRKAIIDSRHLRLVLVTPACFDQGFLPTWLLHEQFGVKPVLKAAAVQRPQVVSGWDFAADNGQRRPKGRPKPTRRLAPAGTIFFLELDGSDSAISIWIDAIWMQCVSDDPQDRRDGFGLAVVGAWNGKLSKLEVK
jgi:CRISPR-associated protein Cmr3